MNNEFVLNHKYRKLINMSKKAGTEKDLYPELIVYFIRQIYSSDDEFALHRQKDTKPLEWQAYNSYCERAKVEAKILLGLN